MDLLDSLNKLDNESFTFLLKEIQKHVDPSEQIIVDGLLLSSSFDFIESLKALVSYIDRSPSSSIKRLLIDKLTFPKSKGKGKEEEVEEIEIIRSHEKFKIYDVSNYLPIPEIVNLILTLEPSFIEQFFSILTNGGYINYEIHDAIISSLIYNPQDTLYSFLLESKDNQKLMQKIAEILSHFNLNIYNSCCCCSCPENFSSRTLSANLYSDENLKNTSEKVPQIIHPETSLDYDDLNEIKDVLKIISPQITSRDILYICFWLELPKREIDMLLCKNKISAQDIGGKLNMIRILDALKTLHGPTPWLQTAAAILGIKLGKVETSLREGK